MNNKTKQHAATILFATLLFAFFAQGAIPVRWTCDTYKVKPHVYECYHGETLDLVSALTSYGEPLDFYGKTAHLFWQTNGMGVAWCKTNAQVRAEGGVTNVLAAVWSGAYDTGADSVTGFIGVDGENYRAAFELRFRHSPGFVPNALPMPPSVIDWASIENVNVDDAPFALKGGGGGGSSITTNDVRGIVDAETGGTNTLAHYGSVAWTNGVADVVTNRVGSGLMWSWNGSTYNVSSSWIDGTWYIYYDDGIIHAVETNAPFGILRIDAIDNYGYPATIVRLETVNKYGFLTTESTNDFPTVSITNGLLSVVDAYQMETNYPSRHSTYEQIDPQVPCLFYSQNPIVVNIRNDPLYVDFSGNWPESKGVFAKISVPASYQVFGDNIVLLGYGAWPTSCTFQAYVWRCGEKYYVNIMSILED